GGSCRKYQSGTECGAASCANITTRKAASTCNGNGTCNAGGQTACGSSQYCSGAGSCVAKKANASQCGNNAECTSGYCGANKACCGGACDCPSATNLVKNPGFDTGLANWDYTTGIQYQDYEWADDCAHSGSVYAIVEVNGYIRQCVPI